jgi:hypothetical protein
LAVMPGIVGAGWEVHRFRTEHGKENLRYRVCPCPWR